MESILGELKPLADLINEADDPYKTYQKLLVSLEKGSLTPHEILDSSSNAFNILVKANVIDPDGNILPRAEESLHQAYGLSAGLSGLSKDLSWQTAVTLPDIYSDLIDEGEFRQTLSILRRMLAQAENKITIASPYFDPGFSNISGILEVTAEKGCEIMILTRMLGDPNSYNSQVLQYIRELFIEKENCRLVSWDCKDRLGIHLKTMIVDREKAYVGSANFTQGGFEKNVELGVFLEGDAVRKLDDFVVELANNVD